MQRAHREMLEAAVILVSLSTVVGVTLIYSITGPLSIENTLPLGSRILYVGLCGLISWPVCHSMSATLLYLMRQRRSHEIALAAIAGSAFMAVACSAVAYTVFGVAGKSYAGGFADIYLSVSLAVAACSTVVHYTACLRARLRSAAESASIESASIESASIESDGTREEDGSDRAPTVPPAGAQPHSAVPAHADSHHAGAETRAANPRRPRFLDRLPGNTGQDVIYLKVSGHYVNAVTAAGSAGILMRFADAIAELDDTGVQIHRSYWVAHRHITAIFRRDERTLVRVTGGHELPVSRTYLTAVRALIPQVAERSEDSGPAPGSATGDFVPGGDIEPRGD